MQALACARGRLRSGKPRSFCKKTLIFSENQPTVQSSLVALSVHCENPLIFFLKSTHSTGAAAMAADAELPLPGAPSPWARVVRRDGHPRGPHRHGQAPSGAPSPYRHVAPVSLASHIATPTARNVGRTGGAVTVAARPPAAGKAAGATTSLGRATDTGASIWPPRRRSIFVYAAMAIWLGCPI